MIRSILLSPVLFIYSLFERMAAVAGALILAQFPSFVSHYIQRLGGHVDELSRLVKEYTVAAQRNSKTLDEYIKLHISSSINDFAETGKIMSHNVERFNDLSMSLNSIKDSDILGKPVAFIKNFDSGIFKATLNDYTLAINLTIESLFYAVMGILAVMIILSFLKFIAKASSKGLFRKKSSNSVEFKS